MRKKKNLTEIEWDIMQILWDKGIASVREVKEEFCKNKVRAYTTIQTYMERLAANGFLEKAKIGMVNFYRPNVNKEDILMKETNRFLKIAFRGSISKMASFLIQSDGIDKEDIDKIKKMIDEKETENE